MKIIHTPRGAGKTTQLIKIASEKEYKLIVCHSRSEVHRVWEMILKMKELKEIENLPPMPITYQEFLDRQYVGKHIDEILIDNADLFLQYLTPIKIGAISLTG
jgi:hypothetical protein